MPWWKSTEPPKSEEPKPPESSLNDQFVTKEYFDASLKTFGDTLSRFAPQQFNQDDKPAPPAPELEPDFGDVPNEAIDQAWVQADESGEAKDYAAARSLERKRNEAQLKRLQHENEKRYQELDARSNAHIGSLQHQNALGTLKGEKHYDRFKEEIEQSLSSIDATQLTPQVAKQVYNLILGNHVDEIAQAEVEQFTRKQAEPPPDVNTRTTRDMQHRDNEDKVTPESVFGAAFLGENARWAGGGHLWGGRGRRNLGDLAQTLGYEDEQEYAELGYAMTQIEDCPDCAMPMTEPFEEGQPHKCPTPSSTHTPGIRHSRAMRR